MIIFRQQYLLNSSSIKMIPETISPQKIQDENLQNSHQNQQGHESPQKRRGRPQKKPEPFFEQGQELFTIHDNVFHVAILFYTFKVFDKAPTRKKFNPTIGFSVYEKVKNFDYELKKYYDKDQIAEKQSQPYSDNFHLVHFFKNSMTFGPKCVIDEFYKLFHFILLKLRDNQQVTVEMCRQFIKDHKLKFINFENQVLDFLQAKTLMIRETLREVINFELNKLLQIIIHTLDCLNRNEKQNKYADILQSEENMFERGVHSKTKKKVKKQSL